ncbi:hypothetical protein DL768_008099 [Monosporascus sp. mg162]|nr:hypothetical protein DL768_008099 [Monosporascus sp. mg162]
MPVQQHVLNWLYSVLTSEYHDVNRTYNDVAQALSQYSSLSPRTDVHTFDNGISALLLHLSGTIPVVFRGTTYRFPISIWVPHAYPREAPLAYVTPTENMMVRPGQHVDPQGRIYHPYLAAWPEFWDKSSLLDFLAILRDIFAKEPPVVSKQQARPPPPQHTPSPNPPPPVPPLPPDVSRQPSIRHHTPQPTDGDRPPPPPPKGHDLPQVVSGPSTVATGPPLPPLPPGVGRETAHPSPPPHPAPMHQPNRLSRYETAPPLPPQPQGQQHQPAPAYHQEPSPHVQYHPQQQQQQPQQPYPPGGPAPPGEGLPPTDSRRTSIAAPTIPYNPAAVPGHPGPPYTTPPPNWQQQQPHHPPPAQPKPKPPPPPDIMDEPLTLALPSPSNAPPPPIPPNPEKDALQRQLGSTLYALRQRARDQNASLLAGLAAQRSAMQTALTKLQSDAAALGPLSATLQSNAAILRQSIRDADGVIEGSRALPAPDIDALLVAPTVVANQLYDAVAEERALGDAIFVLGRAVERGRIGPAVFAKTTRSLAREWYLKKALVRKIGRGMGLVG